MSFDIMKVSIEGSAVSGENWSINPTFTFGDFGGTPDPTFAEMAAAAAAINALTVPGDLLGYISTGFSVTGARLEARKFNGDLVIVGEGVRSSGGDGSGVVTQVPQTALCLSLRTDAAGASSRGRLYWPACGMSIQSADFRISAGTRTTALAAFKTYLTSMEGALNTALGHDNAGLCVWSRKKETALPVTLLQLGNVLDTQRRRRDKLSEAYGTLAY